MALTPLPEEILDRFRSSSRHRLMQIEAAWQALNRGVGTDELAREMHRNVHTLKGDSRMVRFHDIHLLCQKLEDLLSVAANRRYQVGEEFDLVVSMAVDFIGLLLRRRGDQEVSGINIQGFVAHAHQVLRQQSLDPRVDEPSLTLDAAEFTAVDAEDQLSEEARRRLAIAATKVFLEYLSASGSARTRLRSVWTDLRREIQRFDSISLTPLLQRHAEAIAAVAASLDCQVQIDLEIGAELRISSDSLQALDVALMHGLRNVLSHGIESPEERAAVGKAQTGRLAVTSTIADDAANIRVSDDGRGIDAERIRQRAVTTGVMHPDIARDASPEDLFALLFLPGFTTRDTADEMAGRGVGLDAVSCAIQRVGGEVRITGEPDRGTTLEILLPLVRRRAEILAFDAYGGRLVFAVAADWQADWLDIKAVPEPIDPMARLQIRRPEDDTGLVRTGTPQILRLRRDSACFDVVAVKPSRMITAERICRTPDSFPVEVVTVDGVEVLLLRPSRLPVPVPESNDW